MTREHYSPGCSRPIAAADRPSCTADRVRVSLEFSTWWLRGVVFDTAAIAGTFDAWWIRVHAGLRMEPVSRAVVAGTSVRVRTFTIRPPDHWCIWDWDPTERPVVELGQACRELVLRHLPAGPERPVVYAGAAVLVPGTVVVPVALGRSEHRAGPAGVRDGHGAATRSPWTGR